MAAGAGGTFDFVAASEQWAAQAKCGKPQVKKAGSELARAWFSDWDTLTPEMRSRVERLKVMLDRANVAVRPQTDYTGTAAMERFFNMTREEALAAPVSPIPYMFGRFTPVGADNKPYAYTKLVQTCTLAEPKIVAKPVEPEAQPAVFKAEEALKELRQLIVTDVTGIVADYVVRNRTAPSVIGAAAAVVGRPIREFPDLFGGLMHPGVDKVCTGLMTDPESLAHGVPLLYARDEVSAMEAMPPDRYRATIIGKEKNWDKAVVKLRGVVEERLNPSNTYITALGRVMHGVASEDVAAGYGVGTDPVAFADSWDRLLQVLSVGATVHDPGPGMDLEQLTAVVRMAHRLAEWTWMKLVLFETDCFRTAVAAPGYPTQTGTIAGALGRAIRARDQHILESVLVGAFLPTPAELLGVYGIALTTDGERALAAWVVSIWNRHRSNFLFQTVDVVAGRIMVSLARVESDTTQRARVWCDFCSCLVVQAGHMSRCRPPVTATGDWDSERSRAWMGDAVHRTDIRCAYALIGLDKAVAHVEYEHWVMNDTMRRYMVQYYGADPTRSADTVGTQFEANYSGQFRLDYLTRVCGSFIANLVVQFVQYHPPLG